MKRDMRNRSLEDEIRWLPFKDSSHRRMLLCLLARARVSTADDLFVPLYLLAAAGPHSECYVGPSGIDFEGILKASVKMDPAVTALIRLAQALSEEDSQVEIRQVLDALEDTPELAIAMHAIKMEWEL